MDDERSKNGKGKMTHYAVSSQQEVGVRQEGSAKLAVEALIREAYETLKAMIEEEERTGM